MMDGDRYLAALCSAIDRFADQIERADLDAPVPTCPGWDVAALVDHVVVVHTWVGQILEHGRDGARFDDSLVERPPRDPAGYAEWYRGAAGALHAGLGDRDPGAPCWNFSGVDQTVGFWPRRQLHEVNVHAVDAGVAAGVDLAIEPDQAADGIDELFRVFGPRMAMRKISPALPAPITFAATDAGSSWTLLPPGDEGFAAVSDDEPAAVARVAGPANDIFLVLWNRLPDQRLDVEGDAGAVTAYLSSLRAP